ncbi:extracellular solute-binding protein [Nonomuraea sp. MG754425]|uniref:extracellular solute-binding protein n=1 Tax=Nonomuraea sp. MG754425 TaxID=2570319 RepID=UPI001F27C28D|nr:extracellular solute-binding protein [Nonomuraea sp. MG754425]MCF6476580.1 extracellular solute-binding protein [Nonomuraea sp. MG754425]
MSRLRTVLIAVMSLVVLTACSGAGDGSSRELTVWIMGDSSDRFQELVEPFSARTRIRVETVAVPWDSIDQKFTTAVASGKGPDVLQIGLSKLRAYTRSGALLDLAGPTLKGHPGLAARGFVDRTALSGGHASSVPWSSDTRVLFYRSDILAAAGITEPPRTWEQVRADAKVLTARDGGGYGFFIPQWDSALPVIMTWSMGGDIVDAHRRIDFGDPAFRRAVDLYTGLYADGSVPADGDFDQVQGFVSGATPMLVSGPYLAGAISEAAPELAGRWAVAPIPGDVTHTSLLSGSHLGVWRTGHDRDAALRLLDFLSEPRTQLAWYRLDGQLPAVRSALDEVRHAAGPQAAVYAGQLSEARPLPQVPDWDSRTGKALLDALNSIVLTGADPGTALRELSAATRGTSAS